MKYSKSKLHQKGAANSTKKCSAFEAARGTRFHQICRIVRELKYQSTSVSPPLCILGKLANRMIRVEVQGVGMRAHRLASSTPCKGL